MAGETAAQTLQAIKDEIHARVTGASIPDYSLNGVSVRKMQDAELREHLKIYTRLASAESAATTKGSGGFAFARFGRPF